MNYFGIALSDNIARNDQGYVICKDAVLARTGYQEYRVSQLSKSQLRDLGLSERFSDPDEIVRVYRSPEQVFSEATIASFEGMPVTDDHPKEFVTADNHADLQRGHVQNIRRGEQPLSSGDLPLLGDVIITDPDLGEAVLERRKRELSGGYNYELSWDGAKLSQENIIGNHVAVVLKGRAGAEARINDSADIPQPQRKHQMKSLKDWFFGDGLTALAKDNVEPKQIAAMARAFDEGDSPKEEKKEEPKPEEKKAEDADPLAEIKDSLKGICDRLDKLENPESEESEDEDTEAASEEEEAESEDADEEDEEGKGEDAFIQPAASELDLIKVLKPLVARSKDAALRKAFNSAISKANDSAKGGTPQGAYGEVKSAAGKKSAAALDSADAHAAYVAKLNERSQAAFRGQKEVQ